MSARRPCPAAPGPLEGYAARFDDLFTRVAQRRGFREYLAGLLAPRDRNKTLTALAGAEPVTGAQHPAVQRWQFLPLRIPVGPGPGRRGFREYLAGLLAPRDRNKTLTALAGAEPVTGSQHPAVQRLQFFLSESRWDPERVNARRLELLLGGPGDRAARRRGAGDRRFG